MSVTTGAAEDPITRFCTFTVHGFRFGVAISEVREVVRAASVTAVPLAPREVAGLVNLRGELVPVIDLRRRLAMPTRPAGAACIHLVVATPQGPASLLVDAVGDVLDVATGAFLEPPETLTGPGRQLITGACPLADGLLLRLDVPRTLHLESGDDRR